MDLDLIKDIQIVRMSIRKLSKHSIPDRTDGTMFTGPVRLEDAP